MIGVGDMVCGVVTASHCARVYGRVTLPFSAAAFAAGLAIAIEWTEHRGKPVPALVPIVPCMWTVMMVVSFCQRHLCTGKSDDATYVRVEETRDAALPI